MWNDAENCRTVGAGGCGGCQAEGTYWYAGRTVTISGGTYGTTLTLTPSSMERLRWVSGNGMSFGSRHIPADGAVSLTAIYDAQSPSDDLDDIVVQAMVEDTVNGGTLTSCATTMVVRVELKAMDTAPANPCAYRHTFGVYELVDLIHKPSTSSIEWTLQGGGGTEDSVEGYAGPDIGGGYTLRCPLYDNGATLKVSCGGVEYFPTVRFVEPSGIVAYNPRPAGPPDDIPRGVVGCSMWIDLYVTPMDVSFSQIAVVEVPSTTSTYNGYFLHSYPPDRRSHNIDGGAGEWIRIRRSNPNDVREGVGNYFMTDCATTGFLLAVNE